MPGSSAATAGTQCSAVQDVCYTLRLAVVNLYGVVVWRNVNSLPLFPQSDYHGSFALDRRSLMWKGIAHSSLSDTRAQQPRMQF
jgi:hypothetical protein